MDQHMDQDRIAAVLTALRQSWSLASSTKWRPENPALGHCGVSALVAHDHLGGEILKTRYENLWHFYNRIDGQRIDFTVEQFAGAITYDDVPSDRAEAFGDTNAAQYDHLRTAVAQHLSSTALSPVGGNP
ncbi:MAG: hypothetical protein AAFP17_05910 [Pseudomonadota bacterium]